jgi:type II secretory pathway component PulF
MSATLAPIFFGTSLIFSLVMLWHYLFGGQFSGGRQAKAVLQASRPAAKEKGQTVPLRVKKLSTSQAKKEEREILQSLPLVMEQLLLAVQAGHDIVSALRVVLNSAGLLGGAHTTQYSRAKKSPAALQHNKALEKLLEVHLAVEQGRGFEESLHELAKSTRSIPFRHALLHMIVCHREGGELVGPLHELSDACQLCYEEEVEERIAKLPVRATPALICSFAGLLLCAMALPLSKLLDSASSMQIQSNYSQEAR